MSVIYLDNNATTQLDPKVLEAMLPYLTEFYGNPSSMHSFGGKVGREIQTSRHRIAELIGAFPEEIYFTGCGTESDNAAVWSAIRSFPHKKHIVTTRVEHPAIKNFCEDLSRNGYRVTYVPVDKNGRLDLDVLLDSLTPDTAIVSVMWANNETGVIFPVEEISKMVRDRGILFHSDAVQAVGKIPVDISQTGVDMLSISAHKLHGPKGVAALYVRKDIPFRPYLIGGHQESGRRGGTENVASIIGFGKAAELAKEHLPIAEVTVKPLRDKLENEIIQRIPNVIVNGEKENRLPNTSSIGFEYVEGEAILLMLDQFGICASSGSACTSGSLEPSHVLRAMGVPYTAAHGTIRFSLSRFNTEDEIDYVVDKLPQVIERLRKMSPFWEDPAMAERMMCAVQ